MPFSQKIGGNERKVGNSKNSTQKNECLTSKQTKYIYKRVELGSLINKEKIKEEINSDAELGMTDDNSGDENPNRE